MNNRCNAEPRKSKLVVDYFNAHVDVTDGKKLDRWSDVSIKYGPAKPCRTGRRW